MAKNFFDEMRKRRKKKKLALRSVLTFGLSILIDNTKLRAGASRKRGRSSVLNELSDWQKSKVEQLQFIGREKRRRRT